MTRVVGIDLSLTSTGIAVVEGGSVELHRVQSKGAKTATLADRQARLHNLRRSIWDVTRGADMAVIEGPSFGQQRQAGQHDRAGLWWLVIDWLIGHPDGDEFWPTIPVAEVPPAVVKKYATGKGNAGKDEVLAAVVRRYPNADVGSNDEADALVLAAIGARHLDHPIDDMPKTHLTALDSLVWPTSKETP